MRRHVVGESVHPTQLVTRFQASRATTIGGVIELLECDDADDAAIAKPRDIEARLKAGGRMGLKSLTVA